MYGDTVLELLVSMVMYGVNTQMHSWFYMDTPVPLVLYGYQISTVVVGTYGGGMDG
jgi:hypothetical protein